MDQLEPLVKETINRKAKQREAIRDAAKVSPRDETVFLDHPLLLRKTAQCPYSLATSRYCYQSHEHQAKVSARDETVFLDHPSLLRKMAQCPYSLATSRYCYQFHERQAYMLYTMSLLSFSHRQCKRSNFFFEVTRHSSRCNTYL